MLADPLEGVRSVGAVKTVLTYGAQRQRGTALLEFRRQKSEFRAPELQTPNRPQAASTDVRLSINGRDGLCAVRLMEGGMEGW